MAMKESYYTVDGQMLGYKGASGRKDFLRDNLGSVTAEIDQTGSNRTFDGRYRPYGNLLWSTGTSGKFGWVGSWGYRSTGLKASTQYVRARHYSYSSGMWTTVDPLWPYERAYIYVDENPIARFDPLGLSGSCQRNPYASNECSKDNSLEGACIALLCSFGSVKDMVDDAKGIKGIGDKGLEDQIKEIKKLWGKNYSPEECCKKAHGNPTGPHWEWDIKINWRHINKSRLLKFEKGDFEWYVKHFCESVAHIDKNQMRCWVVCNSHSKAQCHNWCDRIKIKAVRDKCHDSCEGRPWDSSDEGVDHSGCACGWKRGK